MNREIWKDIPEWEGLYKVSNHGRIKNIDSGYFFAPTKHHSGSYQITLQSNRFSQSYLVHRLVIEVFKGYKPYNVIHIDKDKSNNCIENLIYGSKNLYNPKAIKKDVKCKINNKSKLQEFVELQSNWFNEKYK